MADTAPLIPAYGGSSLADLPRALLAALDPAALGPTPATGPIPAEPAPIRVEPARAVCVLLIDGLGDEALRAHAGAAPFLSQGMRPVTGATPLTAGFPATTVTSLCSLGTGLTPGEHGMLGVTLAVPDTGLLFNALRWSRPDELVMDPRVWQPAPTVFERARDAGVMAAYVAPGEFEGTGLTQAVHRGARHLAAGTVDERVERAREALREPPAYVTVYYGDLDAAGHDTGWGSEEWLERLATADRLAERLAGALPDGCALYVTADHGMVNATGKLDVEGDPELRRGVALLGGEARARHVYAEEGAAADVLAAWRERLAGQAWVVPREEAVEAGWFGPAVRAEWLRRLGDVLAVPYTGLALVAPRAHAREAAFVGYHGSMTAAEQYVPLLEASTR
ncbi:alkaline phosphatase family protein [Nonomuraea sp. SMC257]|uniref:Alkaline phosphatase family protein n=1 Tax=Nonomuraea montanisoli TaxID=2741721 RepID=A0A7Y6M223_9ACTN|nr:nucleotide pyrophosphatase/phosphodiesterase family protein [Nonomuraea montanisoli]NUW30709.1 alkaline phosphatase family protein [Nonomuraea montanisoli]